MLYSGASAKAPATSLTRTLQLDKKAARLVTDLKAFILLIDYLRYLIPIAKTPYIE
jgi:hypothetical protein